MGQSQARAWACLSLYSRAAPTRTYRNYQNPSELPSPTRLKRLPSSLAASECRYLVGSEVAGLHA